MSVHVYDYSSYSQEIPNLLYHLVSLTFLNFSAEDKTKIVDILAKNCAEKTKLQKLQDKYKKKHNQVYVCIMTFGRVHLGS